MDEPTPSPEDAVQGIPPVPTEAVETPPVTIAPQPEPPGRRRVGRGLSVVIAVLGVLAIGGVAVLGYSLNQDLTSTRSTLATTEGDLGSTTTTLDKTTADLGATTESLAAAKTERTDLDATVADLGAQVSQQTACVKLQTDALDELGRISDLQTANYNRTTRGSTWDEAEVKRNKAVSAALDAYYQAYSKAFDGNKSSARAWADKGQAAEDVIAAQAKQQLAEFALIDSKAKEIEAAINALAAKLTTAEATCAEVAP